MKLTRSLGTLLAMAALAVPAVVSALQIETREVGIGTYVADRSLGGMQDAFDADVGRLYAFSRVVGAEEDIAIYHRWYYEEQLMAEIRLNVRSNNWRTWSSKAVMPEWTGEWRVDVVTDDETMLHSVKFTVD